MSLRIRLLIAIGVIALVALFIADVATYKYLQSFLYQQVDQQLEVSHVRIEGQLNSGQPFLCPATSSGGPGGAPNGAPFNPFPNAVEVQAVEVRSPSGVVVNHQSCAADEDGHS